MAICQSSTDYPYWCNHWNFLNTEERIKPSCFWGKAQTSNFSEMAFKVSISVSITVSPNSVLTGVSSTSDMEINISESDMCFNMYSVLYDFI